MAYCLYLVTEDLAVRHPESVELGGCAHAHRPVVDVVKSVCSVALHGLRLLVPALLYAVGVHAVGEVDRRVDVNHIEEREVGVDRYVVLHTVAPVLYQVRLHEQVFLRGDAVAQTSGVAHGYLLIPALLACHALALEGVEAAYGDIEVGERDCHGGVAHVLVEVGGSADCHAEAGE